MAFSAALQNIHSGKTKGFRIRVLLFQLNQSDERVVTLRELRLDSEGEYRCEVMSESPYFKSSFSSTNLTVVGEWPGETGREGVVVVVLVVIKDHSY